MGAALTNIFFFYSHICKELDLRDLTLSGIELERLDSLEIRLAEDILNEAATTNGNIFLHEGENSFINITRNSFVYSILETTVGRVQPIWEAVSVNNVSPASAVMNRKTLFLCFNRIVRSMRT